MNSMKFLVWNYSWFKATPPPFNLPRPFFQSSFDPPPSAAKTTPSSAKIQEFPPLTITMLLTHSLAELCKISSSCSLRKEKCYYSLWKKVNKKVNKTDAYLLKTWCYNFKASKHYRLATSVVSCLSCQKTIHHSIQLFFVYHELTSSVLFWFARYFMAVCRPALC